MAKGFKSIIEGTNPEIVSDLGLDVVIIRHNAAPTNGATGTMAGYAAPGSLLIVSDGANSALYINTGTKEAPNWTAVS